MLSKHCPECRLLLPIDVRTDLRITTYCESLDHWYRTNVNRRECAKNLAYLYTTFVPLTDNERTTDVRFRHLCAWLEERSFA